MSDTMSSAVDSLDDWTCRALVQGLLAEMLDSGPCPPTGRVGDGGACDGVCEGSVTYGDCVQCQLAYLARNAGVSLAPTDSLAQLALDLDAETTRTLRQAGMLREVCA
jgi:hypothetical protein